MLSSPNKLWNGNFIMLVIGQIVSMFGNAILRFALPMYILLESGSPELMGRVLALSVIPMILISPFGGVLADRINKKRLIVFLDFFTAGAAFIYLWAIGSLSVVPITIIMLMLLMAINSMMSSATDSSFPLIVPADELVRANSVTMAVNTLAMMLGPMLGGILLVEFGLISLLLVAGICFALAAVMETFIRIPYVKQKSSGSLIKLVAGDLGNSLRFAIKTEPVMIKIISTIVLFNLVLSGIAVIGIPVLIIQNLGMDERFVGIASGIMGMGGIAGGILSGILGQRMRIQKSHRMIFIASLCMIPIGLVFLLPVNTIIAYAAMPAMMFAAMGAITLVTIQVMAFTQRITPPELLGKMVALIVTATVLSQPVGNFIYGILFERFTGEPWLILFPASVLAAIIALWSRTFFKKIPVALAAPVAAVSEASAPNAESKNLTARINSYPYFLGVKMKNFNEQQIEIDGIQSINVSCKDTNITLLKTNAPSLLIKEYKSFGRGNSSFNIDKSGNVINITEGKRPLFFDSFYTTEIYLPETFTGSLTVKIRDGNVELNDNFSFNSVTIETSAGRITASEITAQKIKLQTSDGKVKCGTINGDTEINTKDGGIFVDKLSGNIFAKANSGKIQLNDASGSVRAETKEGKILCKVTKPLGNIFLASGDGGVTLDIPKDLYFRFSAKTSGSIKTPFMDRLSRPATDNYTYQGIIGEENKSGNEAVDIKITVKDYRVAVNWLEKSACTYD